MDPAPPPSALDRNAGARRGFWTMLVALVVAVVLERVVIGVTRSGGVTDPLLQVVLADLAVWVPLGFAIAWLLRGLDRNRVRRRLGMSFDLIDVFAAIAIAAVCRAVDASLSTAFFGTSGLVRQASLGGGPDLLLLVVIAVGTVLVSPVLEELFFRGLFQRALASALPRAGRFLAVIVAAALFAVAHVLIGNPASGLAGLEVFLTTFLLGLLVGTLVAVTGRIGGAILAHVLFNAVAVALTWPA